MVLVGRMPTCVVTPKCCSCGKRSGCTSGPSSEPKHLSYEAPLCMILKQKRLITRSWTWLSRAAAGRVTTALGALNPRRATPLFTGGRGSSGTVVPPWRRDGRAASTCLASFSTTDPAPGVQRRRADQVDIVQRRAVVASVCRRSSLAVTDVSGPCSHRSSIKHSPRVAHLGVIGRGSELHQCDDNPAAMGCIVVFVQAPVHCPSRAANPSRDDLPETVQELIYTRRTRGRWPPSDGNDHGMCM